MGSATAKVVALLGVPGSGVSIVSRRLAAHGFKQLRFSEPQRAMLLAGFGLSEADIEGPNGRRPRASLMNHSPQHLLNSLTRQWGRDRVHAALFATEWERRIGEETGFVLADDLTEMVQVEAVRRVGGMIVRVSRPGYTPPRGGHQRIIGHVHDLELVNTGREAFHQVAEAFAAQIVGMADVMAA